MTEALKTLDVAAPQRRLLETKVMDAGGTVAAPVFKDVMTHALQTEKVPPAPGKPTPIKTKLDTPPADDTPGLIKDRGLPGAG